MKINQEGLSLDISVLMAKWADFGITHKRMNKQNTHIDKVKVFPNPDEQVDPVVEVKFSRSEVIDRLRQGTTFITVYKDSEGRYRRGETVRTVLINKIEFIKTLDDKTIKDNLGELPDF